MGLFEKIFKRPVPHGEPGGFSKLCPVTHRFLLAGAEKFMKAN